MKEDLSQPSAEPMVTAYVRTSIEGVRHFVSLIGPRSEMRYIREQMDRELRNAWLTAAYRDARKSEAGTAFLTAQVQLRCLPIAVGPKGLLVIGEEAA